jgi:hypothetical protein
MEGGGVAGITGPEDKDTGAEGTAPRGLKPPKTPGGGGVKARGASGVLTGAPKILGGPLSLGFEKPKKPVGGGVKTGGVGVRD